MEVLAHLTDGEVSAVFVADGGMPVLAHLGLALGESALPTAAFERPVANGLDVDAVVGLVAESSTGWFGRPGLEGCRTGGRDHAPRFVLVGCESDTSFVRFELLDDHAALRLSIEAQLCTGGLLGLRAQVTNTGTTPYAVDALRVSILVGEQAQEVLTFGGRWAHEFLPHRTPWIGNCVTVENRHGKTSHERLPLVVAGTRGFSEQQGEVWACHVAWSGNYELVCDSISDARRVIQAGELLSAGEIELGTDESYSTPEVFVAWSDAGLTGLSRRFHQYMRSRAEHPTSLRPVGMNTWEAVYFDHDLERLDQLAQVAAEVGIERFVLDDGWFHLRRNDHAGLGDWWCDPTVWPDGLTPLIERVRSLGMEFGLWLEPEMVNPDSDLYRAHPDWALADARYPMVLGRNQLVLDLGRPEVRDHVFDLIHRLLTDNDIAYLKWDHNRDMVSAISGGRAGVHRQTVGVYELLARLRSAHPEVEIETCASGGGRVDMEIFRYTQRAWASDSIDALDRQAIQRGFSLLFPPELMGTHIGGPRCHATGRRHTLSFRACAAFFGSMGVEWNLLDASAEDRKTVAEAISLHKELRPLLHGSTVVREDHPDPTVAVHGVVALDRSDALFSITRLANSATQHTPPVRVHGLDPDVSYGVTAIAFDSSHLGPARRQPSWVTEGTIMTGRHLATLGLHAPVMQPESTLLLRLRRHTGG